MSLILYMATSGKQDDSARSLVRVFNTVRGDIGTLTTAGITRDIRELII